MQPHANRHIEQDIDCETPPHIPVDAIAKWQGTARSVEKQAIAVLRELGGCSAYSVTVHTGSDDEVFSLAPGVEQTKQKSVTVLTRLTERQREVLQAMAELNATSWRDRKTAAEIAERSLGDDDAARVKNPLAELRAMGLVESERGRAGGSWLTPEGEARQRLEADAAPSGRV